jgi:signal transduction histidine kinase/ActR/RegA family two-component response regulator
MPSSPDPLVSIPVSSGELTDQPDISSGRRIVWLLGLLVAGFALIIGLQTWFSGLVKELDKKSANERVRLFIGEELLHGIHNIERDVYRLATTSGVKGQQLIEKKVFDHLDKLRHDIQVLKQGGSVRQVVDLNLQGRDQMIRQVDYQPSANESAFVLEFLELTPLLDEIKVTFGQLREMMGQRDKYMAARDVNNLMAEEDKINLFLKGIPPLFIRLTENANRLLYESQNRQTELNAQLAAQKSQLELTKQALILLVVIGVLLPGVLVVRQINATNHKLRLTWEEMRLAKEEAERANLAKSDFLSRMSHELRTPLNAILGFGQLLELEVREVEQADNVQEIMHAGRHLLDLINEVLDLARIESGKFTISQEPVPLLALIEDCLTLIRPMAEARGIRIIEAGQDCSEHVRADRVRLKQVLLNLLSNAVKYNRERGTLSLACMTDGDRVQIRISDTGSGLTPEQQSRLFTAFERLDADKTAIEGAGIGLALSKRLTELMHGEIGVESTPGVGSTFWVRLPATDGHTEPAHAAGGESIQAMNHPASSRRWDVLCIEDNPANLRLIERILSRRDDVRMLSASAPKLGLELAVAHQPALILLDINLPDMDGFDVMKCLRESEATRNIPVVAISANAMPKDLERGKAAGFTDYLTKPLNIEQFLRTVNHILDVTEPSTGRPRPPQ